MGDVIVRKCNACKGEIVISRNESNAIYYDKMYYHKDCFHELATKRSQSKRGKPEKWMAALSHIDTIESETKKMLESAWVKDDLNTWLLGHYDIAMVPARFWQVVADLEMGIYKGNRCKPISMQLLCEEWQWGQRKLNEICNKNRSVHKGPKDDESRLLYDLAILVQKYSLFLSHKEKKNAEKIEMARITNDVNIDMSRIGQSKFAVKRDVSDISDDIFVE